MNLISLTDYEVLTERHDVEIMRRRHLWPYGSFLGLKHRVAVDPYGVPRRAVLYQFNADSEHIPKYMFLPEMNIYSIPSDVWTNSTRYRTGGESLLFDIILEGWVVQ